MRASVVLTTVGMLLVLASCSDEPVVPRTPVVDTKVTVSPDPVFLGDDIAISIEVRGERRATDVVTTCGEPLGYRVRAEDGTVMMEWPDVDCDTTATTVNVGGGRTLTAQYTMPALLVPGRYQVEAGLVGLEDRYPWGTTPLDVVVAAADFTVSGTLSVETYSEYPPDHDEPLKSLVAQSSGFAVVFDSVTAVATGDIVYTELRIRYSRVTGFFPQWAFANPLFAGVFADLVSGFPVVLTATRLEQSGGAPESWFLTVSVELASMGDEYADWVLNSDYNFGIDAAGIPVLENDMQLAGQFTSSHFAHVGDPDNATIMVIRGPVDATVTNALAGSPQTP